MPDRPYSVETAIIATRVIMQECDELIAILTAIITNARLTVREH